MMRELIPAMSLPQEPGKGSVATENSKMTYGQNNQS
jgi:hypothetical protein